MLFRRYQLALILFSAYFLVMLVQTACGGDERSNSSLAGADTIPTQLAGIDPESTLRFEDREYRLVDVLTRNEWSNEVEDYSEVGTTSEASVELPNGEVAVYRRDNDADAIYTRQFAGESGTGEEDAGWLRWIPAEDAIEDPR